MAILIEPYKAEHQAAVRDLNRRLVEGSGDPAMTFSTEAVPRWLPPADNHPVWNEFFVARDGPLVRGAYALKYEQLFIRGRGVRQVACYHHPISEGIIDRRFASVGGLLARNALKRQPLLYALGMGGEDRPIAKMLKALGFKLSLVPFYFRVVRPGRFLREMQALRESMARRLLMDFAALSGLGWLGIRIAQGIRGLGEARESYESASFDQFSTWADVLWEEARQSTGMVFQRDRTTLGLLYPSGGAHLRRIRVDRRGAPVGWAVVGERRKDSKFGGMRVGSILDGWALPEHAAGVIQAATRELERQGMDLIVSNHGHAAWGNAYRRCGFLRGPSNFVFAASNELSTLLQPFDENRASFYIMRADGDGLPANF
ncbi:MAG: hypothetical protein J2P13_07440 [Acidobacteria bacterium]|nr:hypothetical protein [Acidobacteriota bacterium]